MMPGLGWTPVSRPCARGHLPECQRALLPGETPRKRLGIPMFMGDVT
jgi:hypothetical protein